MPYSPVLFRGERDGSLRAEGGYGRPWFFTERFDHAQLYAGKHRPHAMVLTWPTAKVLDLTQFKYKDPVHNEVLQRLTAAFAPEGWVCRRTGEERDALSFIEAGDLYDYETSGSAERWNKLINIVIDDMGYDFLRIQDVTDGTNHQPSNVWVTAQLGLLRRATLGEELAAVMAPEIECPWEITQHWLECDHPSVLERVNRLRVVDPEYRLDRLHEIVPPDEMRKISVAIHQKVWRGLPKGADIRAGDWVALDQAYAQKHQRHVNAENVVSLPRVLASDVYWSGTDMFEFFYMPQAWVNPAATSDENYLRALAPEQVKMLCDGEESSLRRHAHQIQAVREWVSQNHDPKACGYYHGPDHWARVEIHARATARAMGVDPLVPTLFAIVHDSHREDEGADPNHGRRAADWIASERNGLFQFLTRQEWTDLFESCELHSDGYTEANRTVQACWDADRLDLWRVDIQPSPHLLCTPYAKQKVVIADAYKLLHGRMPEIDDEADREDVLNELDALDTAYHG